LKEGQNLIRVRDFYQTTQILKKEKLREEGVKRSGKRAYWGGFSCKEECADFPREACDHLVAYKVPRRWFGRAIIVKKGGEKTSCLLRRTEGGKLI